MATPTIDVRGVKVPQWMYGTAWKEDDTARLTTAALKAGFRAIDTANQRKHYHEAQVGEAIAASGIPRGELFIQTKFTFKDGQDERLPYDPAAPIAAQVEQSFASSREHLQVDTVDSLILHGPSQSGGLGPDDVAAWQAMEAIHAAGGAKLLGVSNVSAKQVADLAKLARVPIAFVQNRCYAAKGWDRDVRTVCAEQGIIYQGFSLLTANRQLLTLNTLMALSRKYNANTSQMVFRYAQQTRMIPLTGTTDSMHMTADLRIDQFTLDEADLWTIDTISDPKAPQPKTPVWEIKALKKQLS